MCCEHKMNSLFADSAFAFYYWILFFFVRKWEMEPLIAAINRQARLQQLDNANKLNIMLSKFGLSKNLIWKFSHKPVGVFVLQLTGADSIEMVSFFILFFTFSTGLRDVTIRISMNHQLELKRFKSWHQKLRILFKIRVPFKWGCLAYLTFSGNYA